MEMPQAETDNSKPVNEKRRTRAVEPDWDEIDLALEAGMSGAQIAESYGLTSSWLYERCKREKKMGFSEYSCQKKLSGNRQLHVAQFQKALAGDNTMLIWLGKNRLDQVDRREVVQISELDQHAKSVIATIKQSLKKSEPLPAEDVVAIAASKHGLDPEQLLDRAKKYAKDDPVILAQLTAIEVGGIQ